jgi:SAM-dependent methyltransferase
MIEQNVYEYVGRNYFSICQDRSVVELGPYNGEFSEQILKHNPIRLELVEASLSAVLTLERKFKTDSRVTTLHADMHRDLHRVGKVDVAVALGVIYHSHAPLFLLEELVNICDPDIILLDAPGANPGWGIVCQAETPNNWGMRYTVNVKKTCNVVIQLYQDTIIQAMQNLGYGVARADKYPYDVNIKSNVPLYQFEKVSNRS